MAPSVLRDVMGSTSPWEHEGTLSTRQFLPHDRGYCLPIAINNAIGKTVVSPQDLLRSREQDTFELRTGAADSRCTLDGWFAISD